MKKTITILTGVLLCAIVCLPQLVKAQIPEKMSYQAVIRNSSDQLIVNKKVGMQISILEGSLFGASIYVEKQSASTNKNGLVSIEIGTGIVLNGNFSAIDWSKGIYFIKTETDPNGATNYSITGTSQLLSVPYALYAKTSGTPGTPGPQGPAGIDGVNGIDGATGSQGPIGLTGEKGVDGAVGPKGETGAKGDKGDQGIQGETGLQGTVGLMGERGADGAVGPKGETGAKGDKGDTGLTGSQGPIGLTGPAGTNGTNGTTGPQGPIGLAGAAGLTTSVNGVTQISGAITLTKVDLGLGNVDNTSDTNKPISNATQTELDNKVDKETGKGLSTNDYTTAEQTKVSNLSGSNTGDQTLPTLSSLGAVASNLAITGATKTKISYDAKGLVTAGTDATTADIAASTNKNYVTDAQQTIIDNTSGTNTGDNAVNSLYSGLDAAKVDKEANKALQANGTIAGQMQYWNGTAWIVVASGTTGQMLTLIDGVPTWTTTLGLKDVYNSTTGKIWMDRNLGATRVATSSTDAASYGDLYQWGRGTDGHQIRTSGTTTILSSSDVPGNGNFITNISGNIDWRSPQNNNLWQGVNGANNPCPTGYRIPTDAELDEERASWSSQNASGAFASSLKLTIAGYRSNTDGSLGFVGSYGYYWSSTISSISAGHLVIQAGSSSMGISGRVYGNSVRCIKD